MNFYVNKKHFEDTWEEAEELVYSSSLAFRIFKLKELLNDFEATKDPELIGKVLFELAGISKDNKINVDAALRSCIDDIKIDNYG